MEVFEDLVNYGRTKAGLAQGSVSTYKENVELIYQGRLIDKSRIQQLTEAEKNEIHKKINSLESENNQATIKIEASNSELNLISKDKSDLEDKLNKYKNGADINKNETFKWHKFVINSIILVALSCFLMFYYLYVFSNAFKDANEIARQMADGENPLALPNWEQTLFLITDNIAYFLLSFLFFAAGYAIHTILEKDYKRQFQKYIIVTLIVLITFIADFLLAFQIHTLANDARVVMGSPKLSFTESPILFLLIILGFVVFILWSILFDTVSKEWDKRDVLNIIKSRIEAKKNELRKKNDEIKDIKLSLEKNKHLINQLKEELNKVRIKISDIEYSITQFTLGWINWLDFIGKGSEEIYTEINEIKSDFIKRLSSSNKVNFNSIN